MDLDRRQFLKMMVTGGLGAVFGSTSLMPDRWKEGGAKLTAVNRQSLVMGSVISFQVIAETEAAGYQAIRKAEHTFRSLEKVFSMYDDESEMALLARQSGKQPVRVSEEALELLSFAKKINHDSKGAFDVTIEPAMKRWGFRQNPGTAIARPTDKELQKLQQIIGTDKLHLEDGKARLTEPGMALDTGGIAGGYALDRAIKEMRKSDVAAAFINFSGDIHCFGEPLKGEKWPVFILDPRTQQPLQQPLMLADEALSTSGAYQNRRHNNADDSWGHLVLPNQAKPIEPVGSVTAIHSSAMAADAWSTAVYVGGNAPDDVDIKILT